MTETEYQYAEMVYLDQKSKHYATWKADTEDIIGRLMTATEATAMWDQVSGRVAS